MLVGAGHLLAVEHLALGHQHVAAHDAPAGHDDVVAVLEQVEQRDARQIDEVDARVGQDRRTGIRIAPR